MYLMNLLFQSRGSCHAAGVYEVHLVWLGSEGLSPPPTPLTAGDRTDITLVSLLSCMLCFDVFICDLVSYNML